MTERLPPVPEPLTPEERALAARLARLGPHGEPSAALDARILAAARTGPSDAAAPARKPARWPLAFGIAASVALAVGLAWQLRPLPERVAYDEAASAVGDTAGAPAAETQAADAKAVPAPAPTMAKPLPPSPAAGDEAPVAFQRAAEPARDTAEEEPRTAATEAADAGHRRKARAGQAPPTPPAPPPAPVVLQAPAVVEPEAADMALPAPPPAAPPASAATATTQAATSQAAAREAAVREAAQRRERNAATAAEARAAESAQDTFAEEPFVEDIPPATADSPEVREAWLYRIRELRDAGRREEARESLMEYVARYPRHDIPDDLEPLLD